MADTLPNVPLAAGVWTDLYAATGITVGTSILIQNLGSNPIYIHAGPDVPVAPIGPDGFKKLPPGREAVNESGDTGAWALSIAVDSIVNVAVA